MRKLPQLKSMMEKPITLVDLATFAALLQGSRNRFFRVVWESGQNKRLRKTGDGAQYKSREVTKLYCLTARNDFSFQNSVLAELERRGASEEGEGWEAQERTWGGHISHTPFVVHQAKGKDDSPEPERLYGHFLPATRKVKKADGTITFQKQYQHVAGETGYYVDGKKVSDEVMEALEYAKAEPETELDKARHTVHPVNARLDDVLWFKIAGHWYRLRQPTQADIEAVKNAALEFSATVEEAAAAA